MARSVGDNDSHPLNTTETKKDLAFSISTIKIFLQLCVVFLNVLLTCRRNQEFFLKKLLSLVYQGLTLFYIYRQLEFPGYETKLPGGVPFMTTKSLRK